MLQISGPDAVEAPFGALIHLDWIEVKRNTAAFRAARRALVFTDDLTKFLGGSPSNSKTKEVVVEVVHRFDDTCESYVFLLASHNDQRIRG